MRGAGAAALLVAQARPWLAGIDRDEDEADTLDFTAIAFPPFT